jgi:hypothetical protein
MTQPVRDALGPPALDLGGFHLWIHRRQFEDAMDRWDGNWLVVTAQVSRAGAAVTVTGPILEAEDLKRFRDEVARLLRLQAGDAMLTSAEPNLQIRIAPSGSAGRVTLRVDLSADPAAQGHWFASTIDHGALTGLLVQLEEIVEVYPVRGRTTATPGAAAASGA